MHTVHGNKFFIEFHKDQSLVHLFSISFCVTYFLEGVSVASYADDTTHYSSKKMFKVKNSIAPEIMKELFAPKISVYDLFNNYSLNRRRANSVCYGTESVSCLGPKIWDLVHNEVKESESLNAFKFKIKRWVPERCPCKIHLMQVGFIIT